MVKITRERFDPNDSEFSEETRQHHLRRYEFASMFFGKRYLDICCGQGYGTALLKKANPKSDVCGLDIDFESIYKAKINNIDCSYQVADITKAFTNEQFDVITFFEAIEHLEDEAGANVINRIYNEVLTPGGVLILSTPRDIQSHDNHYHKSTWSVKRLTEVLGACFPSNTILGQSWATGEISNENVELNDFYICVSRK